MANVTFVTCGAIATQWRACDSSHCRWGVTETQCAASLRGVAAAQRSCGRRAPCTTSPVRKYCTRKLRGRNTADVPGAG